MKTQTQWKRKKDKQVNGVWTNYLNLIIRNENGQDVTRSEDIQKCKQLFSSQENNTDTNVSARDALKSSGWNPSTPAQWALDYLFTNYEMGHSPETVAAKSLYLPESEYFISDQRGVMHLFQDLVLETESKIKLDKKVEKIAYSSKQVEAMTSDGEVFTADYAICTFSTGVLASNAVKFSPPLPKWKEEAILQSPMTVYTKIFLKFSEKFWNDEEFTLVASLSHKFFPVLQNLESPGKFPRGSAVLLITVTEDEGRRIEKQTFEETKEEIVEMLRGVYGQDVPEPTDIFYPCWSTNPFICGAYSEPLVGRTENKLKISVKTSIICTSLARPHQSGSAICRVLTLVAKKRQEQ